MSRVKKLCRFCGRPRGDYGAIGSEACFRGPTCDQLFAAAEARRKGPEMTHPGWTRFKVLAFETSFFDDNLEDSDATMGAPDHATAAKWYAAKLFDEARFEKVLIAVQSPDGVLCVFRVLAEREVRFDVKELEQREAARRG